MIDHNDTPVFAVATAIHPSAPAESYAAAPTTKCLSEKQIQRLQEQGFTRSLAKSLDDVKRAFALRVWIIDNSGSMQTADGHRIIDNMQSSSNTIRMVDCTRWAEIRSCVEYHMRLASLVEAPSRFRLLNRPSMFPGFSGEFSIAEGRNGIDSEFEADDAIHQLRRIRPEGCTPLTSHIRDIRQQVLEMAPALRCSGQRVAIIIATDGLPTDERGQSSEYQRRAFVEALRRLEGLPVWVVIRLCTDEDRVVNFYNDLDAILELSVDVLDDFTAEAEEIREFNPWLNYGLPLHRVREMGHHDRLFDLIDERPFTKGEVRDFCAILFGEDSFDGVPDPTSDWKGFLTHVSRLAQNESDQWNPIKKRRKPWVSVKKLGHRKNMFCG